MAKLRGNDGSVDPAELGDPSLFPHYHENLREGEIPNLYGRGFGAQLLSLEPGEWSGPIKSAYGLHVVLLHEKTEGSVPKLDEVREAVRRDWYAARRTATKEEFFHALLQKYKVVVEEPDFTGADDATPESGQ